MTARGMIRKDREKMIRRDREKMIRKNTVGMSGRTRTSPFPWH